MILDVNEFECVPDGRYLERASIEAGSAVLTDSDGTLRPTDVGKNIAIPGAMDLKATIAGLVEHREVRDAQMAAGSKELTGTLIDPAEDPPREEKFNKAVHVGRRITVAGAGPGNSTLITDIVDVLVDPPRIRLADAASQSVSGVKVILNRPDRVALDDYARRCAWKQTINLKDRTIHDAEMIIGGRGLLSETAKFSSEDLGTPVTILEAGLLVTTIQSIQSNTQATLAAPAERAVTERQADVWKTDSRPGLEALLASLESMEIESAEIVFGPGVYDFTRSPDPTHKMNAAIKLRNLKNLTIRGAGPGVTILRLMPQQDLAGPDTHVIETRECKRFTFRDFSLHGAYLTMDKVNEQMHGLFLNEGSEEIIVERLRVFQTAGDGIRFLGRAANLDLGKEENKVRRVWVDGCQFVQNKRTGVSFQRQVEFVWVRNCYIEMIPPSSDACIDFEPSGKIAGVAPTDIIIDSNFMKHSLRATAVSISGMGGDKPARRIKFSNNVLVGGEIFCTDVDQLTIQNNTVLVTDLGTANRIPVQVQRGGDSVVITGNLLVNDDTATRAVISLTEVNDRKVRRALVANNLCFARIGLGIQCTSTNDVAIQGNMIVATGNCNTGVLVRSQSSAVEDLSIRDNDITVRESDDPAEAPGKWEGGILIAAEPHEIGRVSVTGNSIRGAAHGIEFRHKKFTQTPVCALNRIADDETLPFIGIGNLPTKSIFVGGATSRGGKNPGSGAGRLLAGFGDPNDTGVLGTGVIGNVGDLFQRLDGKPGETLYVKEEGNNTKTGWKAK